MVCARVPASKAWQMEESVGTLPCIAIEEEGRDLWARGRGGGSSCVVRAFEDGAEVGAHAEETLG